MNKMISLLYQLEVVSSFFFFLCFRQHFSSSFSFFGQTRHRHHHRRHHDAGKQLLLQSPLGTYYSQSSYSTSELRAIQRNSKNKRYDNNGALFSTTSSTKEQNNDTKNSNDIENDTLASNKSKIGNVVFVIPSDADTLKSKFGSSSPYGNPSILEATEQLCRKLKWFSDDTIDTSIFILPTTTTTTTPDGKTTGTIDEKDFKIATNPENIQLLRESTILITLKVTETNHLQFLNEQVFNYRMEHNQKIRAGKVDNDTTTKDYLCHFVLDSDEILSSSSLSLSQPLVGSYYANLPSFSSNNIPWSIEASGKRLQDQMMTHFNRWTSDDFAIALLLYLNLFLSIDGDDSKKIDWVKHSIDATWEKGVIQNVQEFATMVDKCGDCIVKCIADEKCKKCLNELTALDTRDQVASYRTIVSFESELLRDFSFCILQKNNIFNCDATIPSLPVVQPITTWRGEPVTRDVGRSILIGHLDDPSAPEGGKKTSVSWKVAAGANVAYDQFPSQNQIFYESANGRDMWYDPVFRVETIDGRNIWCKRHYRVRNGPSPATFYFSVLDNGVTSNEFWTIVAVADDLSWIIFHYAGAAAAVGQRYIGGLLCTADGSLPPKSVLEGEVWTKLRSAGIEPWELFVVDNNVDSSGYKEAGEPPLTILR